MQHLAKLEPPNSNTLKVEKIESALKFGRLAGKCIFNVAEIPFHYSLNR